MSESNFERFIGIDYSGAKAPHEPLTGLRVFIVTRHGHVEEIRPDGSRHWTRQQIYSWLADEISHGPRSLIGIDHGFSFPKIHFLRHALKSWPEMLADFIARTPTHEHSVEDLRQQHRLRVESSTSLRLCETWTSSAKSVFQFDVQGSVSKSTYAGLPWLHLLRQQATEKLHCWPFDGWDIPQQGSVICEVYPSLYKRRYPSADRGKDAHDAYATARWMQDMQQRNVLSNYFQPPLSKEERVIASLEGWILGVC